MQKHILPLLIVGTFGIDALADTRIATIGEQCGLKIPAVCAAEKLEDPFKRDDGVARALREALTSPEEGVRREAFSYLARRYRSLDARRFSGELKRFDALQHWSDGQELLDETELLSAPRSARVNAYGRAITEGEFTSGQALRITRARAVGAACREGLGELRRDLEQWGRLVWRTGEERGYDLALLELRDGAVDEADGNRRAAQRLAEMPGDAAERADLDPGFRRAVLESAATACQRPESDECASASRLRPHLTPALEARIARRATAPQAPSTLGLPARTVLIPDADPLREWLRRLPTSSGPETNLPPR